MSDDQALAFSIRLNDVQLKAVQDILRHEAKQPVAMWEAFFKKHFVKSKKGIVEGAAVWDRLRQDGFTATLMAKQFREWVQIKHGVTAKIGHGGLRLFYGMRLK